MNGYLRIASLAAALLALAPDRADAAIITFDTVGAFSNVQNCTGCSLSHGNQWLDMPGAQLRAARTGGIFMPWLETHLINGFSWDNTASIFPDANFSATYTVYLNITSPAEEVRTITFSFDITQSQTPSPFGGPTLKLTDAMLPDDLGLPLDNIIGMHFKAYGNGAYDGTNWYTAEHVAGVFGDGPGSGHSSMGIYVDFNAPPVPEPSTWAMIILGFAGIGFMGYRRQQGAIGST